MKLRTAVVTAAVVVSAFIVSPVMAGQGGMDRGPGMGKGAAVWDSLSKEQQAQASALRLDGMKKMQALKTQMGQKRIEMAELNASDKKDEQAIQKKTEELWAIQDAMRNERRTMSTKFRALLTPEQREKLGPMGLGTGMDRGRGFGKGMEFGHGGGRMDCPMGQARF